MQIMIDIPDRLIDNEFGYTDIRLHKDIKHINSIATGDYESPYFACLSFVVLPEHHGRLIDADAFIAKLEDVSKRQKYKELLIDEFLTVDDVFKAVIKSLRNEGLAEDDAPTIIEATEEVD